MPQHSGYYHRNAVVEKTTLSATTIWRLTRAGKFPAPVQLSANRVAWLREAVDSWLESKSQTVA